MSPRWGALESEWAHFSKKLGLTADLLPCVSNPQAVIAERSDLARGGKVGKVPSLYMGGKVWGIAGWTQMTPTAARVADWSKVPDYGICIQTRRVRALDIDVPDPVMATAIVRCIEDIAGPCPVRMRSNSGKRLVAFQIEGAFTKRVLKVGPDSVGADGKRIGGPMIELLMNGQQFIAATATHFGPEGPSGVGYEWEGGLPKGFPVWSEETLDEVLATLELLFGVESWTGSGKLRERGPNLDLEDPVASWLTENWTTFGLSSDGLKLMVECPWIDNHTANSGDTEAVWLLRGSEGYTEGHFKCLHGGCQEQHRGRFLEIVGYTAQETMAEFDDLTPVVAEGVCGAATESRDDLAALPLPGFHRNKAGVIYARIGNVIRACEHAQACGWHIRYDTFLDDLMVAPPGTAEWRRVTEADPIRIRRDLENINFEPVTSSMMKDALILVGAERQFDSAQVWLEGLPPWDGVDRCSRFFVDYMPGRDDAYGAALGRYVWSAHAGRVMSPGCQVDITPVLIGSQGIGKSRGVAAVSPAKEFVCKIGFQEKDDDKSRKMRGALVCELDELRGLNSTDAQSIKSFMSRETETWIPKYQERKMSFGRRCVFWGTSNEDEILADPTGERRWAPRRVDKAVDVAGIEQDRDQLWAQGLALYLAQGVAWREVEALAAPEHDAWRVIDAWEDRIAAALDAPSSELGETGTLRESEGFKVEHIATHVLGIDISRYEKRHEVRIRKILTLNGFESVVKRINGQVQRVWAFKKP